MFTEFRGLLVSAVAVEGRFLSVLSRAALLRLRLRALRSGVWFRVLKSAERALVDVTIRVVDRVRSRVLARALLSVVGKLLDAQRSRVEVAVEEFGLPCARSLSLLAQGWGNESARGWMFDLSFARFLAVMHINSRASSAHGCGKNLSSVVEAC
jgi:hypothetical protein